MSKVPSVFIRKTLGKIGGHRCTIEPRGDPSENILRAVAAFVLPVLSEIARGNRIAPITLEGHRKRPVSSAFPAMAGPTNQLFLEERLSLSYAFGVIHGLA